MITSSAEAKFMTRLTPAKRRAAQVMLGSVQALNRDLPISQGKRLKSRAPLEGSVAGWICRRAEMAFRDDPVCRGHPARKIAAASDVPSQGRLPARRYPPD